MKTHTNWATCGLIMAMAAVIVFVDIATISAQESPAAKSNSDAGSADAKNSTATPLAPQPLMPGAKVVALWPAGHPTLKNVDQQEVLNAAKGQPDRIQSVTNVNNPSIELHLAPPDKANGMAVVVAPGGGNTQLVVSTEGTEIANWLNDLGVSAFILRYRLRPYNSAVDALADTQRHPHRPRQCRGVEGRSEANRHHGLFRRRRTGRARRAEIRPRQFRRRRRHRKAKQPPRLCRVGVSRLGPQHGSGRSAKDAPPTFLTSAGLDDASHARQTVDFYNALFNAKIPVELHIYGHGGHGNGIKPRNGIPFGTWPQRFVDWANDLQLMKKM